MNRNRLITILAVGTLTILGGSLAGYLLGQTIPAQIKDDQDTASQDPVERFELGRDSYTPPKVTRRKQVTVQPNENVEYGRMRNGKRVLVPSEPAKKKERMKIMQEQREHDAWRMESFGEPSQFSDAEKSGLYPASETRDPPRTKPVDIEAVDDSPPVTVNGQQMPPAEDAAQANNDRQLSPPLD